MNIFIILPIVLPILAGIVLLLLPEKLLKSRRQLLIVTAISLVCSAVCAVVSISLNTGESLTVYKLVDDLPIFFCIDTMGKVFASIVTLVMLLAGFFSFSYMAHEKHEKRYYGFYLITFGILIGLDYAGNLVTMYLFYELMTLATVPLVLHNESREAVMAGLKYLFYSLCGAYMALLGIYFMNRYADISVFTAGGSLNTVLVLEGGQKSFLLLVVFLMIMGFGVKAGMFPLHAWLPTAHPVAPAPASAVLSGIIVKGGILAIIRVVFYVIGPDFIRGTWVQTVWLILTLVTILMGSALAYKEKVFKKRLAYSTVSNLSYILFGLALLNPTGMTGSLLHVFFHALIKSCLFLCAGAIIVTTGKTKIVQLSGLGKKMPVLFWCFTIASLGLIGIPPTSGIVSKWYLANGALESRIAVFSWLGPVVLLVSALLTAGYLLSITMKAFLEQGEQETQVKKIKVSYFMLIPIIILAVLTIILGVYPTPLIELLSGITAGLM